MIPRLLRPSAGRARPLLGAHTCTRGMATPPPAPAPASRPAAARLRKNVLEVSGPDAARFLKGQMCKDVETLGGGYSGFLNASGRVLHTVFSIPTPAGYLISWEPSSPFPLEALLKPFRLRAKVRFRDASAEYDVWSAWGADAAPAPQHQWRFGSGGAAERLWTWPGERAPLHLADGEAGTWDLRAGFGPAGMGRVVFAPKGKKPSVLREHDEVGLREYTRRRMLLGVPEGDAEIVPGHALPLESDMDVHGGVDFRKGCYLGQELTVRTYHTGATRKRLLPLRLYPVGESRAVSGAPQLHEPADLKWVPPPGAASQRPKPAGKVLAALADEAGAAGAAGALGIGLVRLEFAERACWGADARNGELRTTINGEEWLVQADRGEAFGQAESIKPPPPPPEDD